MIALPATWFLATAVAGPFEPARSRDPLPAREVERPPVLVSGWTLTEVALAASRGELETTTTFAHGMWRRVEGWVQVDGRPGARPAWSGASFGLGALALQSRSRWLRVALGHREPLGDPSDLRDAFVAGSPTPSTWTGLVARQRWGGLRVDLAGEAGLAHAGRWGVGPAADPCGDAWAATTGWVGAGWFAGLRGGALVQAGPLLGEAEAGFAAGSGRVVLPAAPGDAACAGPRGPREPWDAQETVALQVGGGAQLSRGLMLRGGYRGAPGPRPERALVISAEVAW